MFVALTLYNTMLLNHFHLFALSSHNLPRFIFLTQENIALLGSATAWQSSLYHLSGVASKAIDGNTNGLYVTGSNLSVSVTQWSESPSWHVTWPAAHRISRIKVWNRTGYWGYRIKGFVLNI